MTDRPLPWTDLLAAIGEPRLSAVKDALPAAGDPLDRDAFLLNAAAGRLWRDLMPEDAPAEAVTAYGALLHMLFLMWERDWPVARPGAEPLREALAKSEPLAARTPPAAVCYLQLPERLVWAEPEPGAAHEPVDGAFVVAEPGRLRVVAVLGLWPDRGGFTTVEAAASLPAPAPPARDDGSAPFASALPAGERAGLLSVVGELELVAVAAAGLTVAEAAG